MGTLAVLAALRRSWWMPALGLVVGGAAALLVSLLQTPLYTSQTQLFVSTSDPASTSQFVQNSQFSQERVTSYLELLRGEELARRVADELDLDLTPGQLSGEIDASSVARTVLIDVSVTDASPERAQDIAAAVGTEFAELVATLETPAGATESPVKVTVVDQPELPTVASSPRVERNAAVGVLAGLLVGAVVGVARHALDRSVRDPQVAAELAGAPVIGTVLRDSALERSHLVDRTAQSRAAEDYRLLRTNLQFLAVDQPPRVIMVTSALPSEGKTTAVVNLALALVEAGRRVTVLEADLRRPKVTRYLGMVGGVGLTNVLAGTADLEEVVQPYGDGLLSVVGAGPIPPNPGELLASTQMANLLDKLRAANDVVLIDAPPLLPVADAVGLSVLVDGVLLSVRHGSTHKQQFRQAALTLERVGARTLGVVLNIVPPKAEVARAAGYGYEYGRDAPPPA